LEEHVLEGDFGHFPMVYFRGIVLGGREEEEGGRRREKGGRRGDYHDSIVIVTIITMSSPLRHNVTMIIVITYMTHSPEGWEYPSTTMMEVPLYHHDLGCFS